VSGNRFRFRPRFVALIATASGLGLICVGLALGGVLGVAGDIGLVCGAGAAALAPLYAASPAWRLAVVLDDGGLSVVRGHDLRFRLPWPEVVRVVWSPTTTTLFLDGGVPERSLLVPGVGAPAPYDLERKAELCERILDHVPSDKVLLVGTLEELAGSPAGAPPREHAPRGTPGARG
jgi:hypothetical protein